MQPAKPVNQSLKIIRNILICHREAHICRMLGGICNAESARKTDDADGLACGDTRQVRAPVTRVAEDSAGTCLLAFRECRWIGDRCRAVDEADGRAEAGV